jgi:glycosyltransferase involved in cell wall biosynthesis
LTKLKILHIIPALHIGGAEKLILSSIRLLSEHEHFLISFNGDAATLKEFEKVSNLYIKKTITFFSLSNLLFIKKMEKIIAPDIIHAHLLYANWLSRIAFFRKYNLINSIHSLYSKDAFSFHFYTKYAERVSYHHTKTTLVFVSQQVKMDYEEHIPLKQQSYVLPNFTEHAFFNLTPPRYIAGSPLKLIAVGNLKSLKNHALLIAVFRLLKEYPVSLDIYGQGILFNQLQLEVKANNLAINLKGNEDSILEILDQYHGFILPSLYEGLSVALLEAMAASMPLLLSDISVFRELVEERAYYFDPSNPQSCQGAVLKLFNEGFPEPFIASNKELVAKEYTPGIYSARLRNIYNTVLKKARSKTKGYV